MPKPSCRCKSPGAQHPYRRCAHRPEDHPKARLEAKREPTVPGERTLSEDMGGELGAKVREVTGLRMECLGTCRRPVTVDRLFGYPHEGGLADATGQKWWVYYRCQDCGYETAAWKMPVQAHKLELAETDPPGMARPMRDSTGALHVGTSGD